MAIRYDNKTITRVNYGNTTLSKLTVNNVVVYDTEWKLVWVGGEDMKYTVAPSSSLSAGTYTRYQQHTFSLGGVDCRYKKIRLTLDVLNANNQVVSGDLVILDNVQDFDDYTDYETGGASSALGNTIDGEISIERDLYELTISCPFTIVVTKTFTQTTIKYYYLRIRQIELADALQ